MIVTETKLAFTPSRFTNGLVEAGLVSLTITLATVGLPWGVAGIMMGVAAGWWCFVHARRLTGLFRETFVKAIVAIALAAVMIAFVHGLGFALGAALHTLIG